MSADTEVANLLSYAQSATTSLAAESDALVSAATEAIAKPVNFPTWNPPFGSSIGIDAGEGTPSGFSGTPWTPNFEITEEPPAAFPAWPELIFAKAPNTQELDYVTDKIEVEFPELSLPSFTGYKTISELSTFDKSDPNISTDVTVPTAPNIEALFAPTLLNAQSIDTNISIGIPAPNLSPVTTNFSTNGLSTVYSTALAQFRTSIEGDISPWLVEVSAWSDRILTDILPVALDALVNRMTVTTASILSDESHAALTSRLLERLRVERERVEAFVVEDRSGWDFPAAVRQAMADTLEQVQQTKFQTVQAGFYTKTIELALAIFEVFGSLLASFSSGSAKLYEKAIEQLLDIHRQSLAAAKKTVSSLLKLHDLLYIKVQELNLDIAEANLQIAEQQLIAGLVKFEIAKLQLEVEESKQDVDRTNIEILQANVRNAENDVKLFTAKVSVIRSQLEGIKLSSDLFKMKVQAFTARIEAYQAQVEFRVAEIEGDKEKMEGKLLKVKEYEARAEAFDKVIAAKAQLTQAQSDRNDAVLKEFEARIKGVLAPLEQNALKDQYELQKYQVLADNVLTDARIAEKDARARLEFETRKQEINRYAFQFTLDRALDLMKSELSRIEAIAAANESGARIMASMATSAMSSANAVAHTIITESL